MRARTWQLWYRPTLSWSSDRPHTIRLASKVAIPGSPQGNGRYVVYDLTVVEARALANALLGHCARIEDRDQ